LAAARERALEVRKSKAEDKINLKKEFAENDRLKLEATRIQNEKLRKEVEGAKVSTEKGEKDGGKNEDTPSKEQDEKEEPAPTGTKRASSPPPAKPAADKDGGDDDEDLPPHPLQYISDRLNGFADMFEEEMKYKRTKREAKAKEKSLHRPLAHSAYLRGMNANTRAMGNSSLF
jgi:hypothetical protein